MINIIRAHLAALDLVLHQNIKGASDVNAQKLVKKLALAAERFKQMK